MHVSRKRIRLKPEKSFIEHYIHRGMLGKSSVLMMLLVGTGSLVGISSIYTPANVETQPQPQPQPQPQTQKPQVKLGAPLTHLGEPLPQSPAERKMLAAGPTAYQAMQDKALLDRLMPQIINRIDVKLILTQRPGQTAAVEGSNKVSANAGCPPGETAVSAGFEHSWTGGADVSTVNVARSNPNGNPNLWSILSDIDGGGKLYSYAECLKVVLSLKGAQQPQPQTQPQQPPSQPQPPAQPPGGPPLRPPPEFGK